MNLEPDEFTIRTNDVVAKVLDTLKAEKIEARHGIAALMHVLVVGHRLIEETSTERVIGFADGTFWKVRFSMEQIEKTEAFNEAGIMEQ